jgi:hypothetical protein
MAKPGFLARQGEPSLERFEPPKAGPIARRNPSLIIFLFILLTFVFLNPLLSFIYN